jgi:hypothetical protein
MERRTALGWAAATGLVVAASAVAVTSAFGLLGGTDRPSLGRTGPLGTAPSVSTSGRVPGTDAGGTDDAQPFGPGITGPSTSTSTPEPSIPSTTVTTPDPPTPPPTLDDRDDHDDDSGRGRGRGRGRGGDDLDDD